MRTSELVQTHHLQRKAIIYIRQSTGHQVLTNLESHRLQMAMLQRAQDLGWAEDKTELITTDTGSSAATASGRKGYQNLLSQLAQGQVGIVLSYESTRLSRNCSDWYPLLDLCTFQKCLIADRDGVYDPSTPNGRLLLGMKGMLSEIELHTLRGRLLAGIKAKAERGELALALPIGLVRLEDGSVVKEPDRQIQKIIELIFDRFLHLKSAAKVVRALRQQALQLPRRHHNRETVWRSPTLAAVVGILRNPAYAGAFAYGKTRTERRPGQTRSSTRRLPMSEWKVLIRDRYPSYISWETYESIRATLEDNCAEYDRNKTRGVPRPGDAMLQGLVYCRRCGHKMCVQYKGGPQYLCNHLRQQAQEPVCQRLSAKQVDAYVVGAFFEALSVAELDLYEAALVQQRAQQTQMTSAQHQELQRLRYQADLARRRYDKVDPDNRLVAGELEKRWEAALKALSDAEQTFERLRDKQSKVVPLRVSTALKQALSSLGESLPQLWQGDALSRPQKKALLRCLIDKVVLGRMKPDEVEVRIVWRGAHVSEQKIALTVGSFTALSDHEAMEHELLRLQAQGHRDEAIAQMLTEQGYRSPMDPSRVLPSTVRTIRLQRGRLHRYKGRRPRRVEGFLTIPQLATTLEVKVHWIYNYIRTGRISIKRDDKTNLYLFPNRPETLEVLRQLKDGTLSHVSI